MMASIAAGLQVSRARAPALTPVVAAAGTSIALMSTARVPSDWAWATEAALWISVLLLANSVGFSIDDATEPTVAAAPTTLLQRRLAVLFPALAIVGAGWAAVSLLSGTQAVGAHGLILATLTVACASASAAIALRANGRSGLGSCAAVLAILLVVGRLPGEWEAVPDSRDHIGWEAAMGWFAAGLIASAVFLIVSRDPGRPVRRGLASRA